MHYIHHKHAGIPNIKCDPTLRHVSACRPISRAVARCNPPAAAASQDASAATPAAAAYAALCDSIRAEGGFVHPALQQSPSSGGIVAEQDIPQLKGSLVELPLSMRLTGVAAQEMLLDLINAAGLPTM
jgi:hypothetical protein